MKLLVLPKIALETEGERWSALLDVESFSREFIAAESDFRQAGDLGRTGLAELDNIRRRIDHNRNGNFENSEIVSFLRRKIQLLEYGG